jgi:hypothetical protein
MPAETQSNPTGACIAMHLLSFSVHHCLTCLSSSEQASSDCRPRGKQLQSNTSACENRDGTGRKVGTFKLRSCKRVV